MRGRNLPKWPIKPGDPGWPTCKCGCGEPVGRYHRGIEAEGILNGQPHEYKRGHTGRGAKWRGGRKQCGVCEVFKLPAEFGVKGGGVLTRECKACLSDYNRAYRLANFDVRIAADRAYREAHRAQYAEGSRRWREANPDAARAAVRRASATYRARKLDQFIEEVDALVVLERDDGICGICGGDVDPTDFHVDHVIPISRGGLHAYWNVQAAHPGCNISKHNRLD